MDNTSITFDWEQLKEKVLRLKHETKLRETPYYCFALVLLVLCTIGLATITTECLIFKDFYLVYGLGLSLLSMLLTCWFMYLLDKQNYYQTQYHDKAKERKDNIKYMLCKYLCDKEINDIKYEEVELYEIQSFVNKTIDYSYINNISYLISKFEDELNHLKEKDRRRAAIILWVVYVTILFKAVEYSAIAFVWYLGDGTGSLYNSSIVNFVGGWITFVCFAIYYIISYKSNGPINYHSYKAKIRNIEYTLQALNELLETASTFPPIQNKSISSDSFGEYDVLTEHVGIIIDSLTTIIKSISIQKELKKTIQKNNTELREQINGLQNKLEKEKEKNKELSDKLMLVMDKINESESFQKEIQNIISKQNKIISELKGNVNEISNLKQH